MTRKEAEQLVTSLVGWESPRIHGGEWGEDDYAVTAIEPTTHRLMVYSPSSGYFVSV